MRAQPPTNVATAPSTNLSAAENPYTVCGMNSTITDHNDQIEKATWSQTTVQIKLRRAMAWLPASHAAVSSGFQSAMRCEWPLKSPPQRCRAVTVGTQCYRNTADNDRGVNLRSQPGR